MSVISLLHVRLSRVIKIILTYLLMKWNEVQHKLDKVLGKSIKLLDRLNLACCFPRSFAYCDQ